MKRWKKKDSRYGIVISPQATSPPNEWKIHNYLTREREIVGYDDFVFPLQSRNQMCGHSEHRRSSYQPKKINNKEPKPVRESQLSFIGGNNNSGYTNHWSHVIGAVFTLNFHKEPRRVDLTFFFISFFLCNIKNREKHTQKTGGRRKPTEK